MTPALRSRLEAERMFTALDMAEAFNAGWMAAPQDDYRDELGRQYDEDAFMAETLARVQAHLSSDTTRIRPKRQA